MDKEFKELKSLTFDDGVQRNVVVDWEETDESKGGRVLNKPTKLSQFENDSGFITKAVDDLANYYLKSETYTKDEIKQLIGSIPKFSIQVVTALPTSNISGTTVYLLSTGNETNNLYTEYIYVNNKWEYLGKQTVDLSGYALKTEIPTKLSQLTNDSGFLVESQVNSLISAALSGYSKTSHTHPTYESEIDSLKESIVDLDVIVTPQMYGAVGDGTHDDTQAFINALAENDCVFVPQGNYLITDTIDLSYKKSLYSNNGQRATILFGGANTKSVFLIGRQTYFRNVNVEILTNTSGAFSGIVFDVNNQKISSNGLSMHSLVSDSNVKFNEQCLNATVIGITADSGTTAEKQAESAGLSYISYRNITVNGVSGYGIKMELVQGRAFTEENKEGFPYLTHFKFEDVFLGSPKIAIKGGVSVASGVEVFQRVSIGHIMFDNVSSQYTGSHNEKFVELDHFSGAFTNCMAWDYHPILVAGNKYNTAGEGTKLSWIDCFHAPIKCFEFPTETESPTSNPKYFIDKYFETVICGAEYGTIDSKVEALDRKIADELSNENIENIAREVMTETLYEGYSNVMTDPLTVFKLGLRYSNSSKTWASDPGRGALVIPILQGTNIIRWQGDFTLATGYSSVFFFDDDELTTGTLVNEVANLLTETDTDRYLTVYNNEGHKYVSIPFNAKVEMTADNMIVTINKIITSDSGESFVDYLRDNIIIPNVEDQFSKAKSETWTFTLEDGTTVTKKVILS